MTQQLLKKELYVMTIAYAQSIQSLIPEEDYEELIRICQSQAFLNVINKMVQVYADYLTEDQLLYLLKSFKDSKPILTALMANMPSIVERMNDAFEELREDIFLRSEHAAQ